MHWLLALIVLLLLSGPASAQNGRPFDADVISVRGDRTTGETRLDVYTKIPVSNLRFRSGSQGFTARYQVSAEFVTLDDRDRPGRVVESRVWNSVVTVPNFAATQADSVYDFTTQSVLVQPGRYLIRLRLQDQLTDQVHFDEIPVEAKDFRNLIVAMSDLLVLDEFDARAGTISPSVSNAIEIDRAEFALFYEIYARNPQPVSISYEVHRLRMGGGSRLSVRSLFGLLRDGREPQTAEMAFSTTRSVALRAGRNPATLGVPTQQFRVGDYLVRVNVHDENQRILASTEKLISVVWVGMEQFVYQNLDAAIAQLRYIAKERDIRHIEAAPNRAERLTRFREFWARRDPTPNSSRNERMEEYYYRVAYVNRHFGRTSAGWLTDRGEVFIRFGEPDQIERQPLRPGGAPAEVWFYNKIGRRFIFVQKPGSREFELLAPIWDERNRM